MHKDADFVALLRILSLACERHSMRLLAWCLMHNHFHLVLWLARDGDVADFMQWVTTCHVRRYRWHKGSHHGTREATTSACAIWLGLTL